MSALFGLSFSKPYVNLICSDERNSSESLLLRLPLSSASPFLLDFKTPNNEMEQAIRIKL
jgi:hypothetical protein